MGAPPGRLRLLDLLLRRPAAGAARPEGRRLGADLAAGRRLLAGAGIWSTHFIGMLGYDPGIVVGYEMATTALCR